VLASGNVGKLRELRALLADLSYSLVSQGDLHIADVAETGATFLDNALLKARHAARSAGLPALADDSGLEVDALEGRPGVQSARFASPEPNDAANNALLVSELRARGLERSPARYRCVLVCVASGDDAQPLVAQGVWEGEVIAAPRGSGGFGYDPHFFLPELGMSAAQLDPEHKNRLSHRGQALRRLHAALAARAK
jgi:XTP/dITP diphosphohydrolase